MAAPPRLGKIFGVLPRKPRQLAVVVEDVLTKSECDELICQSNHAGYEQALVNIGGGRQIQRTDVRNSDRCIIDDALISKRWWKNLLGRLTTGVSCEDEQRSLALDRLFVRKPSDGRTWKAVGLNERLRFLRYTDGHYFKPHIDGSYEHSPTLRSFATAMVYLNDTQPNSGLTHFLVRKPREDIERHSVQPKAGSVLLFQHNLEHEGGAVAPGDVKYAIRTDVMYARVDHSTKDETDVQESERRQ